MRNSLVALLSIAALLLVPTAGYGAAPAEEATPDPATSVTVLGYGAASAPPDSARVNLYIGDEPTYGPGGPELAFVQPADLEDVRDSLVNNGVDEDKIQIDSFSHNYLYGPSNFAGEISFTYSEVDGLRTFLQALLDEMEERRGPNIQGAKIVFLVDDCAALETAAMRAALDNARQRATRMAALLDMTPGRVTAVSEDLSSNVERPAGGCIALENLTFSSGFTYMGASGVPANSASKVEVGILLKATFALEP